MTNSREDKAAAAAIMEPEGPDEPVTVRLSKPVLAFGEPLKEITLRPPTGGDVQAAGYPLIIGVDETVRFNAAAMTQLIVRLGNVPMKTAQALPLRDWQSCATVIAGFFG